MRHPGALRFTAWLGMLGIILSFSLWGRLLQRWVQGHVDETLLVWGIGLGLLMLVIVGFAGLVRQEGGRVLVHLLWLLPGLALLPVAFPVVEERIHFILFGLFGFFTLRLFPPFIGVLVCALFSGLDELLQWYLPDRVGDWRDVQVNLLASLVGAWFALRRRG